MSANLKVFKNVIDENVTHATSTHPLVSTTSTQRALVRDIKLSNVGNGAVLDIGGRVLSTSTEAGDIELSKSVIIDTNSSLNLTFPTEAEMQFKGMMWFGGTEGHNIVTAQYIDKPKVVSLGTSSIYATSAFSRTHSVTGDLEFYRLHAGNIWQYDHNGLEVSDQETIGNTQTWQMCTDGTYVYAVESGTVIRRKHLETGVSSDITLSSPAFSMEVPGANQGSYLIYHNNKLYSKNIAGRTFVTILDLTTHVVTKITNNDLNVGSYSDGAGLVTTVAGVPYIVEQGTSSYYHWNLDTDTIVKTSIGSQSSTEYGNGFVEFSPGVALIFGEQSDRITIIDMNPITPTQTMIVGNANPWGIAGISNNFGNKFAMAGGQVPVPIRSYTARVAGILVDD